MAIDDKFLGTLFPTREGVATGGANERMMLDSIGGANQIRTRLRENADGSVTRLKTRAGMPEFVTIKSSSGEPTEEYTESTYMESGQLSWSFPGSLNPARYDAGVWHFLVGTTGNWLGKIVAATGTQKNSPPLSEGMVSRAVGYPITGEPVIDAATKADYGDVTVQKKLVMGYFPSSVFSGKMRLFLQAQYGAYETIDPLFKYAVALVGTEPALSYYNSSITIGLGHYPGKSSGILCTSDSKYWLISLDSNGTTICTVTLYPIRLSSTGRAIRRYMSTLGVSASVRTKMECYMLSDATIDTTAPRVVGSHDFGAYGQGAVLDYGWKFNSNGTKASINYTLTLDPGTPTARFSTLRATIEITPTADTSAPDGYAFAVSGATTSAQEWTDGWGSYNLFHTMGSLDVPLQLFSLAIERPNVKPQFDFSNVEIYGWYKDDVWMPLQISRTVRSDSPVYTHSHSGLSFPPDYIFPEADNWLDVAAAQAGDSFHYRKEIAYHGTTMDISFGSFSYSGETTSLTVYDKTLIYDSVNAPTGVVTANFVQRNAGLIFTPSVDPIGFAAYVAAGSRLSVDNTGPYPATGAFVERLNGTARQTTITGTVSTTRNWAMMIPYYDCEAVYIATYDETDFSHGILHEVSVGECAAGDAVYGWPDQPYKEYITTVKTWVPANRPLSGAVVTNTTTDVNEDSDTEVFGFNKIVYGVQGTPSASYYTIFNADMTHQTFDPGMTMVTGLENYIGSEGLATAGVNTSSRFVGWA